MKEVQLTALKTTLTQITSQILTTETQPLKTLTPASYLALTSCWVINTIVALNTPLFLNKSASRPHFVFGGFLCTYFGYSMIYATIDVLRKFVALYSASCVPLRNWANREMISTQCGRNACGRPKRWSIFLPLELLVVN